MRLTCGDEVVPCDCDAPEWVCQGWRHEPYHHHHVVDIGTVIDSEVLNATLRPDERTCTCHDANDVTSRHGDTQPSTTGGSTLLDELWNKWSNEQQKRWLQWFAVNGSPPSSTPSALTLYEHVRKAKPKE